MYTTITTTMMSPLPIPTIILVQYTLLENVSWDWEIFEIHQHHCEPSVVNIPFYNVYVSDHSPMLGSGMLRWLKYIAHPNTPFVHLSKLWNSRWPANRPTCASAQVFKVLQKNHNWPQCTFLRFFMVATQSWIFLEMNLRLYEPLQVNEV